MNAPPVTLAARVAGRLLDTLLATVPYIVAVLAFVNGQFEVAVVALLLTLAYGLLSIATVLTVGALVGPLLLGQRHLDAATGEVARGRVLLKYLVEGLAVSLTFGIGYLIVIATIKGPLRQTVFDRMFGVYVADWRTRESQPAPAVRQQVAPVAAPARIQPVVSEEAGLTVLVPVTPLVEVAGHAPAVAEPEYALTFDDGTRVPLDPTIVVGREPSPRPGVGPARMVPLADPSLKISKSHAAVGSDRDGVWVIDVHSTNGVLVTEPDGTERRIEPGVRKRVGRGSRLRFGGRECEVV